MTFNELRAERNARLAACDFMMLRDYEKTVDEYDVVLVELYRQALRDLPALYADDEEIESVDWPVKPF